MVEERTAELRVLATTDALTGTLNRRRFFEEAEDERARSVRYKHPLSLAMLDLDHFKSINDRFGHAAGDEALRKAAAVMRRVVRRQDRVGRYGGEEFGVLFPVTGLDEAMSVAERLRREIASERILAGDEPIELRVSCGVAAWQVDESIDATLRRADTALYQAKQSGRNRVIAAG